MTQHSGINGALFSIFCTRARCDRATGSTMAAPSDDCLSRTCVRGCGGPVPQEKFDASAADAPLLAHWVATPLPCCLPPPPPALPSRRSIREMVWQLRRHSYDVFLDTFAAFRGFASELITLETVLVSG